MKFIVRLFCLFLLLNSFLLPATAAYEIELSEGIWLNPYPKIGDISRLVLDEHHGKYSVQVFVAESAQFSGNWTEREIGNVLLHMRRGRRSIFFEAEVSGLFVAIRPSLVDGRMHIKVKNSRLGGTRRPIRNEFGEFIDSSKEYFLERYNTATRTASADKYGTKAKETLPSPSPFQQRPRFKQENSSTQNYMFPEPYAYQERYRSGYLREEDFSTRPVYDYDPQRPSHTGDLSRPLRPQERPSTNYSSPTKRPFSSQAPSPSLDNLATQPDSYQSQTERPSLPPARTWARAPETARGLPPNTNTRARQANRGLNLKKKPSPSLSTRTTVPKEIEWSVSNERRFLVELHKKQAGGTLSFVDLIYSGETVSRKSMSGETWVLWDRHAKKTIKEITPQYAGEQFVLGAEIAKTRGVPHQIQESEPQYQEEAGFATGAVLLQVFNQSSDQVNVFLKHKSGKDEFKFALKPGTLKKVEGMPRSKWEFRSARSGKILGTYTSNKREEQIYTVKN